METKIENKSNNKQTSTGWGITRIFRRFFIQITFIIFLIFVFGSFELGRYTVYRSHPNLYAQDRASAVLKNISALIQLPKGAPTMAVINNASSAKKIQPFLAHANDGDVLVVYKDASEAILYRPSTNKLISVGPIYKSEKTLQKSSQKKTVSVTNTTKQATTTKHESTSTPSSK